MLFNKCRRFNVFVPVKFFEGTEQYLVGLSTDEEFDQALLYFAKKHNN